MRIDIQRAALVFIEFQHEWLGGKLEERLVQDKAALWSAVAAAARLLAHARARRWTIAHAGLSFATDPTYLLFGGADGAPKLGLRGAIPRAGTWTEAGARFVEPFVPRPGEFVVQGRSGASVLKSSTLDPFLRNHDINTILLCGFATHVCVESTLREAHDLGYDAYVVADACAAFERAQHEHVLEHVVHHFGGHLTSDDLSRY